MYSVKLRSIYYLSFVFCILISLNSLAGKAPIKYGKPAIEDLEMTVYEPDSTAAAVILCNYGYFNALKYEFVQTIRVKILKKSGMHWGNRSYYSMGNDARVRGKTFNLEDGELVESKLKKESIFNKRSVNKLYTIKVAMPNVRVGSVIDIEVISKGVPSKWRFQELIPVRKSELEMEDSQYIEYQKNFFGYLPIKTLSLNHWASSDVPAFKIEPFMDSYKNYINKIEFDVKRISFPGYYKEYASSWEDVGKILLESEYFGHILRGGSSYLKDLAENIENECSTDKEKIKMAYEKIKAVKWNDSKSDVASTTSLGSIYKDKIGNSTDINLLLIKLLARLEIEAYPVVLSSRDNGLLSIALPSLNKLTGIGA